MVGVPITSGTKRPLEHDERQRTHEKNVRESQAQHDARVKKMKMEEKQRLDLITESESVFKRKEGRSLLNYIVHGFDPLYGFECQKRMADIFFDGLVKELNATTHLLFPTLPEKIRRHIFTFSNPMDMLKQHIYQQYGKNATHSQLQALGFYISWRLRVIEDQYFTLSGNWSILANEVNEPTAINRVLFMLDEGYGEKCEVLHQVFWRIHQELTLMKSLPVPDDVRNHIMSLVDPIDGLDRGIELPKPSSSPLDDFPLMGVDKPLKTATRKQRPLIVEALRKLQASYKVPCD